MDLRGATATKVLGALCLLAVAALGWTFVVGPETSALSETQDQVQSIRQQNAALLKQVSQLEQQKAGLRATRQMAAELAGQFPPTADQPGLFAQVTAAAVDAGIGAKGVTTLAPTPPVISAAGGVTAEQQGVRAGTIATQDVSVAVTGTYEQTRRLLENLEHMERAYLITSVDLSGSGEGGAEYTTTIAGQMFVMPPLVDPDTETAQN